jgi:small-conductance mechanosensitive channel
LSSSGVVLAAVAPTLSLAFGLGSRGVARALSAGRYVRGDYAIGEDIELGDLRGWISKIHSTSITIDTGDGRSIRVPNHLLIDEIVTVHLAQRGLES